MNQSKEAGLQGWDILQDHNANDLIKLAKKHYQDAIISKEWVRLDEDQQMILALQTEVKEFKAVAKFKKMGKHRDKGDTIRSVNSTRRFGCQDEEAKPTIGATITTFCVYTRLLNAN